MHWRWTKNRCRCALISPKSQNPDHKKITVYDCSIHLILWYNIISKTKLKVIFFQKLICGGSMRLITEPWLRRVLWLVVQKSPQLYNYGTHTVEKSPQLLDQRITVELLHCKVLASAATLDPYNLSSWPSQTGWTAPDTIPDTLWQKLFFRSNLICKGESIWLLRPSEAAKLKLLVAAAS